MPSGRRFARQLQTAFTHVDRSRVVWRSVPPSIAYRCRGVVRMQVA